MFARGKIYTVYEKPEAIEPTDRVALVREGFSLWALIFGLLWLLANRLWLAALGYVALTAAINLGGSYLGLSEVTTLLLQILLEVMLAFSAYDLIRWQLARRNYRFSGILTAESAMQAQRRYYEFAS